MQQPSQKQREKEQAAIPLNQQPTETANSGQIDFYLECAKHALCYHAVNF